MSCNCKVIKDVEDVEDSIVKYMDSNKLTFFTKFVIIFNFLEFYFYFVTTSIMNFVVFDKLEPSIPKRLINRYKKYG